MRPELQVCGILHNSPCSAFNLVKALNEIQPDIVLIEIPSDFQSLIPLVLVQDVRPPFIFQAYDLQGRSINFPLTIYTPEYQAIIWAAQHKKTIRCIDLPACHQIVYEKFKPNLLQNTKEESPDCLMEHIEEFDRKYENLILNLEHQPEIFLASIQEIYQEFRQEHESNLNRNDRELELIRLRESYMMKQIEDTIEEGYALDQIFVIVGAYHLKAIKSNELETNQDFLKIAKTEVTINLAYTSYDNLANLYDWKAPKYREMIWKHLNQNSLDRLPLEYLSELADIIRRNLNLYLSSAHLISALELANALAAIRNHKFPILNDLHESLITICSDPDIEEIISLAKELFIGYDKGYLPQEYHNSLLLQDFNYQIELLQLNSFFYSKAKHTEQIELDLRKVDNKGGKIDLKKSIFLHRLWLILCKFYYSNGNITNWNETWNYTIFKNINITLSQHSIYSNTIKDEASRILKNYVIETAELQELCHDILATSIFCDLSHIYEEVSELIKTKIATSYSLIALADAIKNLDFILNFKIIYEFNTQFIYDIFYQIYIRVCSIISRESHCSNAKARDLLPKIQYLDFSFQQYPNIDQYNLWHKELINICQNNTVNPLISGFTLSKIIEHDLLQETIINNEIQFRLSENQHIEKATLWVEGFISYNVKVLITKHEIWFVLVRFIEQLSPELFAENLIYLRRAFANCDRDTKNKIAEIVCQILNLDINQVSDMLLSNLSEEDLNYMANLKKFI
ncbi:MAG: DUF5682 family protein [Chitinophagales bacterium]|jgi:hypothetical protein|nr:DUF5682 family protein [Chitinophagales bacterium]